jgi:hypothetical protein
MVSQATLCSGVNADQDERAVSMICLLLKDEPDTRYIALPTEVCSPVQRLKFGGLRPSSATCKSTSQNEFIEKRKFVVYRIEAFEYVISFRKFVISNKLSFLW